MRTQHLAGLILALLIVIQPASPALAMRKSPLSFPPSSQTLLQTLPSGPSVVKVYYQSHSALEQLAADLDIWEVHPDQGFLLAQVTPDQFARLVQDGYQVAIDNARTFELTRRLETLPGQVSGIPGRPCYRTVEETYASLAQLASNHPWIATWKDIGDSWEKVTPGGLPGYDLHVLVLTNQSKPGPKPAFLLLAAIHARELATAETATRYAKYLVQNYGLDPDVTWLLDRYEIHIMAMGNPDGRKIAETGQAWRKNTDNDDGCSTTFGTDLNRNSNFKWGWTGASTNACHDTFRGVSARSEPETQAIEDYLSSLFPDQRGPVDSDPAPGEAAGLMITLHSYGELVLWPWGWTGAQAPNHGQLQTLGQKLAYFNGYQAAQSIYLYPTSGTNDDWAYGVLGVAAYTIEMGTDFFQSCSSFENQVYPDNLRALLFAAKSARRPYQDPAGPEITGVTLSPARLSPGGPVQLAATANDSRFAPGEPVQNIQAVRYFVDLPSWEAGSTAIAVAPKDGTFDSPIEGAQAVIDTTGWAPGRHLIFVEAQDASGRWGVPSAAFLWIEPRYGLGLTSADQQEDGFAGSTVTYTLNLTNTGEVTDTFDFTQSSNNWPVAIDPSAIELPAGLSASIPVVVSIPIATPSGQTDQVIVQARSRGSPAHTAEVALTTSALPTYGFSLRPEKQTLAGYAGRAVAFAVDLTNTGNLTDTYAISATGYVWGVAVPAQIGPLTAGTRQTFPVSVTIPEGSPSGAEDSVTITVTSAGNPERAIQISLRTSVFWDLYAPMVSKATPLD